MSRRSKLITLLLTLNAAALPLAAAWADPFDPDVGEHVLLPYQATVLDDHGDPVDGNHAIEVRLFGDDSSGAELLYAETFAGHVIEGGSLTLVIGAGEPQVDELELGAEVLWRHPEAVLEIAIDGEVLGARHRLGTVPRALHARRVPAGGVRFGDGHGLVPAKALEPHVAVAEGIYAQGELLEGLPEGADWHCEHTVTAASPGAERDRLHAQDLWIGKVGPGSLAPAPGLTITFGDPGGIIVPGLDPAREVFYMHAWSDCGATWGPGCEWHVEPADPELRVHVTSMCTRF